MPPSNDDFVNAIDLGSALSGTVRGTNVGATTEVGEPVASDSGQPAPAVTVWWKWTCPAGPPDYAAFSTRDSGFDTVLGVYTGAAVNALTEIASSDDSPAAGGHGWSQVVFAPVAGTTYYIQVDGYDSSETGDIVLTWQAGPIPIPVVTEGHGTGTDSVTFTVGTTGYRGVAVAVLGGNWSPAVGELGLFAVSPGGNWAIRENVHDPSGFKVAEVWTCTFDDEFVAPTHLTPTFTAKDGLGNPVTPGAAKIAYAWTYIAYPDVDQWEATFSTSGQQLATTTTQVVDPTLAVGTFLETAAHYVGVAALFTSVLDVLGNPISLSASADPPLSHEAQDHNSGPVTYFGVHDWQALVGIASDVNIVPSGGMSGTRTWTTTWTTSFRDSYAGPSGAGVIVRAYPALVPAPAGGGWGRRRFGGSGF